MGSSLRSFTTTTYASRTNTTFSAPAGIADGDHLLLAFIVALASPPAATMPSGFTVLSGPTRVTFSGFSVDRYLAYKPASGESGSYLVTHATASSDGKLLCIQGGTGTPLFTTNSGTGTTTTALGVTTVQNDTWVGFFGHNWQLYGTASPPTGSTPTFTERDDVATSLIYFADGVLAAAGATGDKTHTNLNGAGEGWGAFLVAVTAASSLAFDQYGWRGRNDDGTEVTATYKAAQNAPFTITPDETFRLRTGVDTTGNQASQQFKLQYRKVGAASWRDVDTQG